jgi:transcriptional regulator with XRE-family HTH domain
MVTLGTKIRTIRALRGVSAPALSKITGINQSNISEYECNRITPRPSSLQKLEAALNIRFNAPAVEAAFAVLADDAAKADEVRMALAILEPSNGNRKS